ncbi:MAG: RecQ family ATP-dependent DNA helicase [Bacteroidetes bacterium HGW-Bacteroidetes-5]|jgi:ATP-dependent DNA helicase RecQ|nr:MAG: RecQ family ATP-dependent DNA helicase [Bacteroidetes bacterium HGW-Bacteroidetes-5]
MDSPLDILKKYWSFESFRPLQEDIINSVLENRDTLALLPTGGGKSLCFQIPALIKDGICIVISPLIALMKDQVENLRSRGIKALSVHSGMTANEVDAALDNAIFGNYKFLYLSPERARTEIFRVRAAKMNISFIVVDEAHCISQWGYDFRPEYLLIKEILEVTGPLPIIALTATATTEVAKDIMDKLAFREPNLIKGRFERDNLSYVVRHSEDKNGQLLKIIRSVKGSSIVYVRERRRAEEVSAFLRSQGISADSYHAGFSSKLRTSKQDEWHSGITSVIVSTNAFGMGIDKGDVRFVCHFDIPESIEAYFQEAGRAGRDGNRSYAVLLWNSNDIRRLRQIASITFPEIDFIKEIYQKLYRYFNYSYGSGKGESVRFNLLEFASKYKIHTSTIYYAIKYLESCGYVKLTEELDNPSRIMFLVNRDELYAIQLKNESLDSFIKSLLRLYEGLFSGYLSIDEEYIARVTRNSRAAVVSMLIKLSRMGVIGYIPGARSPLLIFLEERLEEKGLYISENEYNKRKDSFVKRTEAVIEYVNEETICRSRYLTSYFGQSEGSDCGICDICIGKRRLREGKYYLQEIERRLIEILMESSRTMEEISSMIEDESGCYLDILREMADRGGVKVDGEKIILVKGIK